MKIHKYLSQNEVIELIMSLSEKYDVNSVSELISHLEDDEPDMFIRV